MCAEMGTGIHSIEQFDESNWREFQWHGLQWHRDGHAAISGDLLQCLTLLDARILQWAEKLNATEFLFPNFISVQDLAPTGYCASFPHLATFAHTPKLEVDNLHQFKQGSKTAVTDNVDWQATKQVLTPAACYHFYHRFKDNNIADTTYLTTKCMCHRREEYYAPLQRQWNFTMREVVCFSDSEGISDFLESAKAFILSLVDELGIKASWRQATDPFFDPCHDTKAISQIVEPVKQELCLESGLAIASINDHRSFFADCYNISYREQPAKSACVAFGLERWLFALFYQHGKNIASWPLGESYE